MATVTFPYAILPLQDTNIVIDYDNDEDPNSVHRSILNVSDNKCFKWNNMFKDHPGAWCVGSSNDWLFLLDSNGFPSLLNPSSGTSINLPIFSNELLHPISYSYFLELLRKTFVYKAVLMPSPSPSQYTLVIMYSLPCKLAFCTHHSTWIKLYDAKRSYCDIVFHNNVLYALAEDVSIEGWEFCNKRTPRKILDVKPTMEIEETKDREFPSDLFDTQIYLVISKTEFLLVKRYTGNFVNADGVVVYEGYSDDDHEICGYRTKHFDVYKLDFVNMKWEKKRSLHDQILFLGANESISVPSKAFSGCEGNSIYFSDDRWEEMNMDYSYGGHDWGVFNVQDGSVKLLTPNEDKMDPPPIWVVPTLDDFRN